MKWLVELLAVLVADPRVQSAAKALAMALVAATVAHVSGAQPLVAGVVAAALAPFVS